VANEIPTPFKERDGSVFADEWMIIFTSPFHYLRESKKSENYVVDNKNQHNLDQWVTMAQYW